MRSQLEADRYKVGLIFNLNLNNGLTAIQSRIFKKEISLFTFVRDFDITHTNT